jgi:hypothetical protein
MAESSVSRCVAVAAHGKRCQQTPFRGSPYCWHHTQSRKVWAPSRTRAPIPAPRPPESRPPQVPAPARRPVAAVPEPTGEENMAAILAVLAERLDAKDFAELVHFLANVDTGSLLLVKDDGDLVDVRLERVRTPRTTRARRAKG